MSGAGDNTNIYDGIEAVRPGSDDLQLAELSHVAEAIAADEELELCFEQVQRSDAALASTFRDVTAPDGLQNRLLAALQAESAPPTDKPEPLPQHRPGVSRRTVVTSAVAASLLIAVGATALIWNWSAPIDADGWVAAAGELQNSLGESWQNMESAPANRGVGSQLHHGVQVVRWQQVGSKFDRHAVAYELTHARAGISASLFVFRPRAVDANLPLAPPVVPTQSSSQSTTGVWTSDGLVYVLVVSGGREQYQGFIRTSDIAAVLFRWATLA